MASSSAFVQLVSLLPRQDVSSSTLCARTRLPSICSARRAATAVRASSLDDMLAARSSAEGAQDITPPVTATPVDVLLGELMFSDPDQLPKLVEQRLAAINDEFYAYIDEKVNSSLDLEERESLNMFKEAIQDLAGSVTQVIDTIKDAEESGLSPEEAARLGAQKAYDALLTLLTENPDGNAIATAVINNYDSIDSRFLETLSDARKESAGSERGAILDLVQDAIAAEMGKRIELATNRLVSVMQAGNPKQMEKQLMNVASRGWLDEAFLLLLTANIDQAAKADPNHPVVGILKGLQRMAIELKDSNVAPELALIRRLLRTEEKSVRKTLLVEALTPGSQIMLSTGRASSGYKVEGKALVAALRKLIEDFGNLDGGKFVDRLSEIGSESEEVARELYGLEQKDLKELQDDAFHKRAISVWELEKIEMEHEVRGTTAPWEDSKPAGFDEEGKMIV